MARWVLYGAVKGYERVLGPVLSEGAAAHGDSVEMRPIECYHGPEHDGSIIIGIVKRSVLWDHQRLGAPLLYLDKGFIRERQAFRGENLPKWWRLCVGAVHPTEYLGRVKRPHDRLAASGLDRLAERVPGRKLIVLAGSSAKFHETMRLPHPTEWARDIIAQIREITDAPIIYRPKPSRSAAEAVEGATFDHGAKTPIDNYLGRAHALVTYGSIASVDAIRLGVPAIVLGNAPARPVASTSLEALRDPWWPSQAERLQWAANLSYTQFTPAELSSGLAWQIVGPGSPRRPRRFR